MQQRETNIVFEMLPLHPPARPGQPATLTPPLVRSSGWRVHSGRGQHRLPEGVYALCSLLWR
jgi:hypothetical protein